MANGLFTPQGVVSPEEVLQQTGFAQPGAFAAPTIEEIQATLRQAGAGAPLVQPSRQIGSTALATGMGGGGIASAIRDMKARHIVRDATQEGVDISTEAGAREVGQRLAERGLVSQAQAQFARAAEMQRANIPPRPKYQKADVPFEGPGGAAWKRTVIIDEMGNEVREIGRGPLGKGVSVSYGAEKEESKAKVEIAKEDYKAVQERGTIARNELNAAQTGRVLLEDPNFDTGAIEPLRVKVGAYAQDLGIDPETLGLSRADNAEKFRNIMSNLVLTRVKALRPATDRDVIFVTKTVGDLGNTKESNLFANRALQAVARQDALKSKFYGDQFEATPLTEIAGNWRDSPYNVPIVGKPKGKTGNPVFWHEYYDTISNMTKPDGSPIPIEEIKERWMTEYER